MSPVTVESTIGDALRASIEADALQTLDQIVRAFEGEHLAGVCVHGDFSKELIGALRDDNPSLSRADRDIIRPLLPTWWDELKALLANAKEQQ